MSGTGVTKIYAKQGLRDNLTDSNKTKNLINFLIKKAIRSLFPQKIIDSEMSFWKLIEFMDPLKHVLCNSVVGMREEVNLPMINRAVGPCLQVGGNVQSGGQKEGILSKNLYFEGILVKF